MTDQSQTDGPNLGGDSTIPNTADGIAVGHDPDGSHFNPEEEGSDGTVAGGQDARDDLPVTPAAEPAGSYTDAEGDDREDRPAEASGTYTDVDE